MTETLGPYKILREIGKGGMGIIYKALNPSTQKVVAIKVLPPMMVDRVTVERFHREVQAMIQLKHPCIIEVHESGMQEGKHFLVMEFIEGENLKNLIKAKGPLPMDRVLQVSLCVADALAHMHHLGMIHRDIKPANIMVMPDGRVKLMDYGLVKILGRTSVTLEGSSLGTAEYMSPEQITGQAVDVRTDIYSLGIAIYEMVTGSVPFSGQTLEEILHKHQTQIPVAVRQLRPQAPVLLQQIIDKAMAKELERRYDCIEELKKDLEKLVLLPQNSLKVPAANFKSATYAVSKNYDGSKSQHLLAKSLNSSSINAGQMFWAKIFVLAVLVIGGFVYYEKVGDLLKKMPWKKFSIPVGSNDMVKETNAALTRLEQAEVHFNQGQSYHKQGLLDEAENEITAAIALRNDQPVYLKELAFIYEKKNDCKKAIKAWEDLLKYETNVSQVKMAQEHIRRLSEKLQ